MGLSEVITKKVIAAARSVLGRGENGGGKLGVWTDISVSDWASFGHAQEAVWNEGPGIQRSLGEEPQTPPRQPPTAQADIEGSDFPQSHQF